MDAGYAIRPVGGTGVFAPRRDAEASGPGVRTELSAANAVAAPREAAGARGPGPDGGNEAGARAALREFVEHRLVLDVAARTMVTQTVNVATGEVIGQFPEQETLKLRAYVREMGASGSGSSSPDRRTEAVA